MGWWDWLTPQQVQPQDFDMSGIGMGYDEPQQQAPRLGMAAAQPPTQDVLGDIPANTFDMGHIENAAMNNPNVPPAPEPQAPAVDPQWQAQHFPTGTSFPGGISDEQLMPTADVPQEAHVPTQWENFAAHPVVRAIGRGLRTVGTGIKNAWQGTGIPGMAAREYERYKALGGLGEMNKFHQYITAPFKYAAGRGALGVAEHYYDKLKGNMNDREAHPTLNKFLDFVPGGRTMANIGTTVYPTANDYWQDRVRGTMAENAGSFLDGPMVSNAVRGIGNALPIPGAGTLANMITTPEGRNSLGRWGSAAYRVAGQGANWLGNQARGAWSNLADRLRGNNGA
jgi:hypothetical protein